MTDIDKATEAAMTALDGWVDEIVIRRIVAAAAPILLAERDVALDAEAEAVQTELNNWAHIVHEKHGKADGDVAAYTLTLHASDAVRLISRMAGQTGRAENTLIEAEGRNQNLAETVAELERQRDEAWALLDRFRKPMGYVVLAMDRATETWSLWDDQLHHTDEAGMAVTNHAGDVGAHACLTACFPVGALDALKVAATDGQHVGQAGQGGETP